MMPHTQTPAVSLVLTRRDVRRLLGIRECIGVVEHAFRLDADGATIPAGVLGVHVDSGGFHIKTAGFRLATADGYQAFAAKSRAKLTRMPAVAPQMYRLA